MRDLYVILSVVGWAWCLLVAAFLWVRLRQISQTRGDAMEDSAGHGTSEGRPEAEA